MPPALAAVLLLSQMSPAQATELRRYRYGKTAAQIEAMGFRAYSDLFETKTPNFDAGFMRGVAYAVFTDAYRENTERRYRASLAPEARARMVALDRQVRFIGVLFQRNHWLFYGGNATDPESDDMDFAEAERRLYTLRYGNLDEARVRRWLATYRAEILQRSRKERLEGAFGRHSEGRIALGANVDKIERAIGGAKGFCRAPAERAVLFDFVAGQAKARL